MRLRLRATSPLKGDARPASSNGGSLRVRFAFRDFHHLSMRLLLAIFLPFVAFFTIGRPIAGIVCLILGFPYHVDGYFYDFGVIDLVNVGRVMVYASLVFSLTSAVGYMSLFAQAIEQRDNAT